MAYNQHGGYQQPPARRQQYPPQPNPPRGPPQQQQSYGNEHDGYSSYNGYQGANPNVNDSYNGYDEYQRNPHWNEEYADVAAGPYQQEQHSSSGQHGGYGGQRGAYPPRGVPRGPPPGAQRGAPRGMPQSRGVPRGRGGPMGPPRQPIPPNHQFQEPQPHQYRDQYQEPYQEPYQEQYQDQYQDQRQDQYSEPYQQPSAPGRPSVDSQRSQYAPEQRRANPVDVVPGSGHRGDRQMPAKPKGHTFVPPPRRDSEMALPFDNPFPVFPTTNPKKPKPKPTSNATSMEESMSGMSLDSSRPSVDSSRTINSGNSGGSSGQHSMKPLPTGPDQGAWPNNSQAQRAQSRDGQRPPPIQAQYHGTPGEMRSMPHSAAPTDHSFRPGALQRPPTNNSAIAPPPRSAAMDLPQRPSTTTGTRPRVVNPPQQRYYAHDDAPLPLPPTSQMPDSRPKHESLGTFYDDYLDQYDEPATQYAQARPEAEMPNFDAAEPSPRSRHEHAISQHLDNSILPPQVGNFSRPHTPNGSNAQQNQNAYAGQNQFPRRGDSIGGSAQGMPTNMAGAGSSTVNMNGHMQNGSMMANGYSSSQPQQPPQPDYNRLGTPSNSRYQQQRMPPQGASTPVMPPQGMPPQGMPPPQPYAQGRPGPQNPALNRLAMPSMQRNLTGATQRSDPGPGISPMSAGPTNGFGSFSTQPRPSMEGQTDLRPGALPQRRSDPDALPHHPTPVRPGLMQGSVVQQQSGPVPVRQYNGDSSSLKGPVPSITPRPSVDQKRASFPVTSEELDQLRQIVKNNPQDDKTHFRLGKKLVEASVALVPGTMDPKARAKTREKFIFEATKHLKKASSHGYPEAMFYLADSYGQGSLGLAVDTKEAFTLYQGAAKLGHGPSAYRTAVCCEMGAEEGGGTRKDPLKAVQWYRRAAALSDTPAMYKLGMILLKGLLGQQKNLGESINWLQRAADRADEENPHALHELGLLYESAPPQGKLIRDEKYAFQLFEKAAKLGYKFSQFRLGEAFEYGLLGCQINQHASIAWYSRAAKQEEHQSELALSGWYLTGAPGILEQSDTEAYLWAKKAAAAELPKAMFALGYFTEVGIGTDKSLEEAKRWYSRAAVLKYPKAQERLDELRKGGMKAQKSRERLSRTNQQQSEENCTVM
ncbi:hypothetical protein K402DRAFT_418921 [Aulographum hederae CBS 113979]|uniref:HCP-like protein n=1 Tax=Aulographum hederae CBS 113979 TaxID=1176131 RepID=A0A6G1H7V3_9PEZI|nr:hypothetical protein K402DRAFT_418921 [Aulographum hederae CBS 113979]